MTREDVLNSIALKKRFCKDCNIPIAVFDNPYFSERLETLDILNDCEFKFYKFCLELESFDSEQDYFEHYNSVKDKMITHIKNNPTYQVFNEQNIDKLDVGVNKRNLYVEQNDGGTFVSIDMKQANFTALRQFSKSIFDNCETWEEFVGKFTDSKHMAKSKYIRQVVMGACNPKQQIKFERFLMSILCKHIMDTVDGDVNIYSLGDDEIIITIDNPNEPSEFSSGFSLNELRVAINTCIGGIGELVRVDMFDLHKIGNVGWMKTYYGDEDRVEFKCLDAEIFHQIVKHYYGVPITEDDLVFYHNGRLAKFLKEVDNPWKE